MACPACVRVAQAVKELPSLLNVSGTSRMPLEPSAWQDWHMFLTVSIHAAWDFMVGAMPALPGAPAMKSAFCGMVSNEYQYMPG